ncbi:Glutathione S-transferase family protein [Alteromonas sp. 38]|jgi:glutathione S-transferase|uniref:glutathione S-transferase family protein n=1 Tax=Alteromonas TaxID=226 RepID=UPI0012F377D7|nr:Glutathione S-transferase family protein [Alteromonas sp. 154]VXB75069.1 Glutathione S-transferase family protein [Alteromonas sp. 38]
MATHAIFEELGVSYELIEIDLAKNMQKSPEYLAINPNGKVPTLVHEGRVIYESAAILLYVIDQYPESGLAPDIHSPARGLYYQYLFWMSSTLQEAANRWAHPEQYVSGDSNLQQVKDNANDMLTHCWGVLEKVLTNNGPWLVGEQLTAADFHLFMVAYWSRRYASKAQDWPHLNAHYQTMLSRNAVKNMMAQEGLD